MPRTPELIIFDFDGTLIDAFDLYTEGYRAVFQARLGRRLSDAEIFDVDTTTESGIFPKLLPADQVAAARSEFQSFYLAHFDDYTRPICGMPELIHSLQRHHVRCAMFTGKSRVATDFTLGRMDLANSFLPIVTEDDGPPKPDPHGLALILAETGVDRERALFVGDSPTDVMCARSLGVRVFAVSWGGHDRHELETASPDALYDFPGALLTDLLA